MGLFDAYQSPDWFQVLCALCVRVLLKYQQSRSWGLLSIGVMCTYWTSVQEKQLIKSMVSAVICEEGEGGKKNYMSVQNV